MRVFLHIAIFTFLGLSAAQSANKTMDSIYYGWVVYEESDDGGKKCFIAATPHKSNSSHSGVREPYLAITRYQNGRTEEISISAGYEYKISSKVHLLIGEHQKELFTHKNMAWAQNDYEDKQIISLILKSPYIKVRSDSAIGDFAIDEYSAKGLVRAYGRMKALCN